MPFVDRLYTLLAEKAIAVSPCSEQGTRFLDPPNATYGEGRRRNVDA